MTKSNDIDPEKLLEIYRRSMRVFKTDERFREMLTSGKLRLVYYPVRGQEVLSASMMCALKPDDYLVTTYRGVHDQVSKGIPLKDLWAEFTGKVTGTCKGKGGPMHITDPDSGVMVTTGIVGGGLPIANGLALSSQLAGDGRVTVVSFGDGSSNIGAFHESLNLASIWKLPVIFLCQNNRYGEHTAYAASTAAKQIIDRAPGYDMAAIRVNGNDPIEMYNAAREAVERARAGEGPTLIEAMTYRMLGHTFGADFSYVPKDLQQEAKEKDPIPLFKKMMLDRGTSEKALAAIEDEITKELDEAVEHALSSDFPEIDEIRFDVLKEEIPA
ncbi:thiamine pyrophosphate-dependent dehydrogenase E1 component subunit alpha [Henriciella litoralis]|uniref:thiamine pyrophosphate-dependent dehydrogenase E1 component subunit alpha n=1 Tax=Henriciella litoralis TaxID=568102 RepID=UPI000A04DBD0|nr:thiamine pyrophosphate-dependent dehydrogenase E1 component subunit alpha [Henriciella litoralis]